MAHLIITLLLAVCFAGDAVGQPGIRRTVDLGFRSFDIYQTVDRAFAVCGSTNENVKTIARLDTSMHSTWNHQYGNGHLFSIVETDEGNFLAGGGSGELYMGSWVGLDGGSFEVLLVDDQGGQIWRNSYGQGECRSVIELKSGEFILIGYQLGWNARIVMIQPNGREIWNRNYVANNEANSSWLWGARETDGGIVAAGMAWFGGSYASWWIKVDFQGNVVWSDTGRANPESNNPSNASSLAATADGGFLTSNQAVSAPENGDVMAVMKINSQGEFQWVRRYRDTGSLASSVQIARCGNDGYVLAGELLSGRWDERTRTDNNMGVIARIGNDGNRRWWSIVRPRAYSVIYTLDQSIIVCGVSSLVEIEPEVIGPTIVNAIPLSTHPVVLPADSLFFAIQATNQWGDEITYAFFQDDDQIAGDSSVTVQFHDLGRVDITGRAYSGGDSDQVVWNVEVTDLYIAAQTPDTLDLLIRRDSELDFSIDSIRAVGGEENISYLWSRLNIDTEEREDVGEDSSVTIQFPEEGRYQVEGQAYRDESSDRVVWNVRVRAGILDLGNATLDVELGRFARVPVTIFNDEADTLHWQAVVRTPGDAGADPWTLRQNFPVSEITGDDRIDGAIFDGESYFLVGANGDDPNTVYRLSPEGNLLGSFPQPGHSRYGFKDIEWDGESIWGSGEDTVFAISRDGEVVHRWLAPSDPTNNIAYDPDEGVLWLSGTISAIKAYDREGNYLDRSLDRQGLRTYGLAWFADDPDDFCLYALNVPGNDTTRINKINTLTGEMAVVTTLLPDSAMSVNNAFICRDFDKYQGWVMLTMANIPANAGGDQLRVIQLQPNTEWLTVRPESGEIPPDGSAEVDIRISTARWNGDWAFEPGEYEGEIVFTHDGQGGRDVLPVHLTVVEPNQVGKWASGQVNKLELFEAYPNPFNSSTTISFDVGAQGFAPLYLAIYDLQGRLVEVLVSGRLPAGQHSVVWDGSNLPAGVYLIRLESAGKVAVAKGVIIK